MEKPKLRSYEKRNLSYFNMKGDKLNIRCNNAKYSARKRNIEFNITVEYLRYLLKQQDGRCAYTGLEFDNNSKMHSISIDRIDSDKGYIEGNVQLVLTCINFMKQEYSEEHFIEMCKLVYLNSI